MKLVEVCASEWYPVEPLLVKNPTQYSSEIPDELWDRWVNIEKEFEDIQKLLEKYYKARQW